MSSIFGMNNVEFGSGSWPIRDEIVYMGKLRLWSQALDYGDDD